MRSHFYFGFVALWFLFPRGIQAALLDAQDLERSVDVKIEVAGSQVRFEVREEWTNTLSEAQLINFYQPTVNGASFKWYRDAEGRNAQTLENQIVYLAEKVQASEDERFFSLLQKPFTNVWTVPEISVEAGESVNIKYEWTETALSVDDFNALTVFLDPTQSEPLKFSVTVVWNTLLKHWVPINMPKGRWLEEDGQTVWQLEKESFQFIKPVSFLWSTQSNPTLKYARDEFLYEAFFSEPTQTAQASDRVLIMLDKSGSMYGNRWSRVEDLLPEVLKFLPASNRIKIGLFDEEWQFLSDEFEPNTFDQQKIWVESIQEIIPTGKSDWAFWLRFLESVNDSDRFDKIIVLGDFSDFQTPSEEAFWSEFSKPILFLDFGKNQTLNDWAQLFGGQRVTLYTSLYDTFEIPEIKREWLYLGGVWESLGFQDLTEQSEVRPVKRVKPDKSLLFINRLKRTDFETAYDPFLQFLPGLWGQYQVAYHLEKNRGTLAFDEAAKAAINAINNYYGLGLETNLADSFLALNAQEARSKIEDLEQLPSWDNWSPLWQGQPVINQQPFGYISKAEDSPQYLAIKPYSEAYRQLFEDYPDRLVELFSWGPAAAACFDHRCVELIESGETDITAAHRLFWDRSYGSHWADAYLLELAAKNIVSVPVSGEFPLSENTTRGEFMMWVAEYLYAQELTQMILPDNPAFTDLPNDVRMAKSLTLLKDKGIVEGFGNGLVKPEQPLLRAEAVKILLALKGFEPSVNDFFLGEPKPFLDLSGWETPWVLEAYRQEVVRGYEDQTFRPFNVLNKAEAAKILVEMLED